MKEPKRAKYTKTIQQRDHFPNISTIMTRKLWIPEHFETIESFHDALNMFVPGKIDVNYIKEANEIVVKDLRFNLPSAYRNVPFLAIYYIRELLRNDMLLTPDI